MTHVRMEIQFDGDVEGEWRSVVMGSIQAAKAHARDLRRNRWNGDSNHKRLFRIYEDGKLIYVSQPPTEKSGRLQWNRHWGEE